MTGIEARTADARRAAHHATRAAGAVVLSLTLGALALARQEPAPPAAPAAPAETAETAARAEPPAPWMPRYHTEHEVAAWVRAWVATGGARALALPATRGGREAPALEFGADGPTPLAERPTVFLFGGLDGLSLSGAEAVLRCADELLRARASLPTGVAFVALPWASPDGLARTLAGEACGGRDLLAVDDDGDLAADEDPPDDLDGDGHVLEMLIDDPDGPWARGPDPRFLVPARPGDRPRYVRAPEGRDDDADGRFNEDARGGAVLDLVFPVGWSGEPGGVGGLLPLDDELSRALADLVRARPPLAVLLFQGNHGLLARAGGVANLAWSDGPGTSADQAAVRLFVEATGRAQAAPVTVREARGAPRPGAAIDWVHAVTGALALEVAAWGPRVERDAPPRPAVADARFDARNGGAPEVASPSHGDVERDWIRWLDDVRGGIGFVDWHPFELSSGRSVLLGGWLPFARDNAPVESLDAATRGLPGFVRRLAAAAPSLDLRVLEASRDGEVVTLRVRLENPGRLPTGLAGGPDRGARFEIALPTGARLLWGESEARLGVLGAGEAGRELTAVALVPEGAALKLSARAPWAAPVEKELRP